MATAGVDGTGAALGAAVIPGISEGAAVAAGVDGSGWGFEVA
jgi:hypothetical protein